MSCFRIAGDRPGLLTEVYCPAGKGHYRHEIRLRARSLQVKEATRNYLNSRLQVGHVFGSTRVPSGPLGTFPQRGHLYLARVLARNHPIKPKLAAMYGTHRGTVGNVILIKTPPKNMAALGHVTKSQRRLRR